MTTHYDTKDYSVHGERGDWCLNVKDECGESTYITHYEKKEWAILAGREFASRVASGDKLENILAIDVWKTIEPYCS